jgi:hypothetical protein
MQMRGRLTIVVVSVGALLSSRGAAQSEPHLPEQYLAVKVGLSIGGSVNVHSDGRTLKHSDGEQVIAVAPVDEKSNLASASLAAEVDYLFSAHRYLALGGLFGLHSWHSEAADRTGEASSFGLDVGLVIQPRLPLSSRVEFYLSVPLSLTLSLLNEYKTWTERQHTDQGVAEDVDPAYGFGVGVMLGARYALRGRFGVLLELGYQRFAFTHDVNFRIGEDIDPMGSGTRLGLDLVTQQFRLNAGVFF